MALIVPNKKASFYKECIDNKTAKANFDDALHAPRSEGDDMISLENIDFGDLRRNSEKRVAVRDRKATAKKTTSKTTAAEHIEDMLKFENFEASHFTLHTSHFALWPTSLHLTSPSLHCTFSSFVICTFVICLVHLYLYYLYLTWSQCVCNVSIFCSVSEFIIYLCWRVNARGKETCWWHATL